MASVLADPSLMDLTYYNNRSYGGVGEDEVNSSRAQTMLSNLQKFDPNAKFNPTYTGDGSLLGYQLQYDPSKLPGASGQGQLGGANPSNAGGNSYASGSSYMPNWSTVQQNMKLMNPQMTANSPIYGRITPNANINTDRSWVDTYGPALVGGFGMLAGGALSGLNSMLLRAPQTIGNWASGNGRFNPFQLAGAGLGFVPGMNPFMAQLARFGLNNLGRG